jgi:hypothetical protein
MRFGPDPQITIPANGFWKRRQERPDRRPHSITRSEDRKTFLHNGRQPQKAFAPDMTCFKRGRDFAAWLGLVPRQHSSGGKERLGRVSKAGQIDIRQLLIVGAMSRLNWLGRKSIPAGSWLARLLARKPRMLVAVALANKMARAIWAMLTKQENYRHPAMSPA